MPDLRFLNGLRALAALWVLTAHCLIWGGADPHLVPDAKLAVDLFMMLSGFLMMQTTYHHGDSKEARWRNFYIRRFFRIAPAYYLILFAAAASPWFADGYSILFHLPRAIPMGAVYDPVHTTYTAQVISSHASFLFGLIPSQVDATLLPDWSLSLEMQFYLAFPLLFALFYRVGPARSTIALTVGALIITHYLNIIPGQRGNLLFPEPSILPMKLQYFLAGMLLFTYRFDRRPGKGGRAWVALLALALAVSEFRHYRADTLYNAAFVGIFWLMLTDTAKTWRPIKWLHAVLSSKLGELGSNASYCVYLVHGFFISACGFLIFQNPALSGLSMPAKSALLFVITLVGAYGLAALIYRTIELPGIAIGRWLVSRRPKEAIA